MSNTVVIIVISMPLAKMVCNWTKLYTMSDVPALMVLNRLLGSATRLCDYQFIRNFRGIIPLITNVTEIPAMILNFL